MCERGAKQVRCKASGAGHFHLASMPQSSRLWLLPTRLAPVDVHTANGLRMCGWVFLRNRDAGNDQDRSAMHLLLLDAALRIPGVPAIALLPLSHLGFVHVQLSRQASQHPIS